MKRCNQCGAEFPDSAKFCGNCGGELVDVPGKAINEQDRLGELQKAEKEKQSVGETPKPRPNQSPKKRGDSKALVWVGLGLLALVAIIIGVSQFGKSSEVTEQLIDSVETDIAEQEKVFPEEIIVIVGNIEFKMKYVEGGEFVMGTSDTNAHWNSKPAHRVSLSSYYMGQTEVTQALWLAVMGANPSYHTSEHGYDENLQRPVEEVSWDDCQKFIEKLNKLKGMRFRLPTEAEWEYAARGGIKSRGYKYAGSDCIDDIAWYCKNSGDSYLYDEEPDYFKCLDNNWRTHPVGLKSANELGLYDMTGNVNEWCHDLLDQNYYKNSPTDNPQGPLSSSSSTPIRVCRGGSIRAGIFGPSIIVDRWGAPHSDRYTGLRLALNAD